MDAARVVQIATSFNVEDEESSVKFAKLIAEHCAQLAEEMPLPTTPHQVAMHIRRMFKI